MPAMPLNPALLQAQLPGNLADSHRLILELTQQLQQLAQSVEYLKRKLFGRSSERMRVDPAELTFFGEADVPGLDVQLETPPANDTPDRTAAATSPAKKKSRGKRRIIPDNLPIERVVHDLTPEEKFCEHCQAERELLGEEVSRKLEIVPPKLYILEHVTMKYVCRVPGCPCAVTQAQRPSALIPKAVAGPSLLAWTMTSKYCDHLPLHRLEKILRRSGVELPRKTQCEWMMQCGEELEILRQTLLAEILKSNVVFTDDTTLPLQEDKKVVNAYLWVYGGDAAHPYVVYDFTRGCGREGPMEILRAYEGCLQADAFAGYNELFKSGRIVECGCWAHARRKFFDAKTSEPALALIFLELIRQLYRYEDAAQEYELSHDEIVDLRRKCAWPVLEKIKHKLKDLSQVALPQSALGKAIGYALNNWTALTQYVNRGFVRIDNNLAENAIRPIVLGRKNWLFAGSRRGGHAAATICSLIQSAIRNGVEPFEYLTDIITRLPDHPRHKIHELLPDRWKALRDANKPRPAEASKPA